MKLWLLYMGVGAVFLALAALVLSALLSPASGPAVWFAAASAWVIQAVAFGALVSVRKRRRRFLWGWVGGVAFRFLAVVVLAFWATRRATFPARPALMTLVAFVFVLVLVEPLFLRMSE